MATSENERMTKLITSFWVTQIVHAAATFSLADHLANGPAAAADIAAAAGTDPSATFRLLRACVTLGLATYDGEARFAATPLLETLRTDNPQSLRDMAMLMAGLQHWLPWGRFTEAVKTGKPQSVVTLGKAVFEYIAERPVESEMFARTMARSLTYAGQEVARLLPIGAATVVADIGGAAGSLLHAVLQANPGPRGIVFDLPAIANHAIDAAAAVGLEHRITAVGGDFLESVPAVDLYLLRYILHDWNDASCVRILRNCRRAMLPGARLVLIEQVLGKTDEPDPVALMDVNMLVMLGGKERSQAEYRQLLEAAGLSLTTVTPTATPMATMIEAVAAP